MKNIVLIIAGGVCARMCQDIPKQFINVYDKPVIVYTLEAVSYTHLGSAIPLIGIGVAFCFLIWRNGRTLYNKAYWKYGLAIGLPLLPHVISQSLLSQVDRIMIKDMVGSSEAGRCV